MIETEISEISASPDLAATWSLNMRSEYLLAVRMTTKQKLPLECGIHIRALFILSEHEVGGDDTDLVAMSVLEGHGPNGHIGLLSKRSGYNGIKKEFSRDCIHSFASHTVPSL